MSKYNPNHRQLQITNQYICNAYVRVLNALREEVKTPSLSSSCDSQLIGMNRLLMEMGLELVEGNNGYRVRKITKDSIIKRLKKK